jgi:hypothetical protein
MIGEQLRLDFRSSLTSSRFQHWTRFCGGVIFVVNKDRLQTEINSQQRPALVNTLLEINEAKARTGYSIPLMILINKVCPLPSRLLTVDHTLGRGGDG